MKKHALVTGANRGLGLELVRQLKQRGYEVTGCCRNVASAKELKALADQVLHLDVTKDEDIQKLVQSLNNKPIDFLVNNAGISGVSGVTIKNVDRENFLEVLNVNCVSVIKICDALLPNVQMSADKNILVISSQMGSIADNQRGRSYAYRSSKAALNCVMRSFAIDVQDSGVHVMLIHPGWVKTDMGGSDALVSVEESVAGILKEADQHISKSHAERLRRFDGGSIAW